MEKEKQTLNVVIIGGSLAGLMQGISFKHRGHNVRILERSEKAERESQAAGIGCGPFVQQFCQQHGIDYTKLGMRHPISYHLDKNLKQLRTRPYNSFVSSWSVFYHALRAHFDGFTSSSCPQQVPPRSSGHGEAIFDLGKRVISISLTLGARPVIIYEDLRNHQHIQTEADVVIAADGALSTLRRQTVPKTSKPYSGYVAWRGTVPERELSSPTVDSFQRTVLCTLERGTYMVVYVIPSDAGEIESGSRVINWLRYETMPLDSPTFQQTMTDTSGTVHRNTLPSGQMQPAVWRASVERVERIKPDTRLLELLHKTKQPFITAISDVKPPNLATIVRLAKCRFFLVGEAFALERPHSGNSTNQAAMHALRLSSLISGKINEAEWATHCIQFANLHANISKYVAARMMDKGVLPRTRYLSAALFYMAKGKLLDRVGVLAYRWVPLVMLGGLVAAVVQLVRSW